MNNGFPIWGSIQQKNYVHIFLVANLSSTIEMGVQ